MSAIGPDPCCEAGYRAVIDYVVVVFGGLVPWLAEHHPLHCAVSGGSTPSTFFPKLFFQPAVCFIVLAMFTCAPVVACHVGGCRLVLSL